MSQNQQPPEAFAAPGAPMMAPDRELPHPPPPTPAPTPAPTLIPFIFHDGGHAGPYVERVGSPFMIPVHASNSEYREYQEWVAKGSPKV